MIYLKNGGIKLKKILFLFTIFILGGCSLDSAGEADLQPITFGAISSVDVLPLVIAEENGYFEDEGIDVNLELFNSANDRDSAYISGQLDGMICDMIAINLYQNSDVDLKITGVTDGDFRLIARPDIGIDDITDLVDQTVAISDHTSIEYALDKIVEANGLDQNDPNKTIVPAVPVRLEMLRNQQVDVALLPEPFSALALNDGYILLGSAKELGYYTSVTAFSQDVIDEKAEELERFYTAYNQAVDYLNDTPIDVYEDIVIEIVGYAEDMKGSIENPVFRTNQLPTEEELQEVIDWVTEKDLIDDAFTPDQLINDIGI